MMPEREAKKAWMKENSIMITVRLMRRTEDDIVSYLDKMQEKGIARGALIKAALREYMNNHKED